MTRLQRSRLKTTVLLLILGTTLSLALLGFLSRQMAEGRDPVLLQKVERPVIHKTITEVKKVIKPRRTIYIREKSPQASYSAPSYSAPSYSAPSYSAPSYSAPSYSAPVVSSAS